MPHPSLVHPSHDRLHGKGPNETGEGKYSWVFKRPKLISLEAKRRLQTRYMLGCRANLRYTHDRWRCLLPLIMHLGPPPACTVKHMTMTTHGSKRCMGQFRTRVSLVSAMRASTTYSPSGGTRHRVLPLPTSYAGVKETFQTVRRAIRDTQAVFCTHNATSRH